MANYTRGSNANIIVGAAALFAFEDGQMADSDLPASENGKSYKESLTNDVDFRNVGYTSNGLELQFQPDFGEVQVDQVLDVAKLYKQGMQVNLNTSFAEATLENLLLAIARPSGDFAIGDGTTSLYAGEDVLNLSAGDLGDFPVERGLVAVGPSSGTEPGVAERIYVAYRALSIDNVTVSAKREEATMFDVSFRLLPNDLGSYGKIVDRTIGTTGSSGGALTL
jgi:hypothetical protein